MMKKRNKRNYTGKKNELKEQVEAELLLVSPDYADVLAEQIEAEFRGDIDV